MKAVVSLFAASCLAAVEKDAIPDLPGWGKPPSKMYAGYVPANDGNKSMDGKIHMHYWFVESEGNPATDPLLIWSNGGPGASSVFGLLTELGPLMLSENSFKTKDYNKTGVPSFFRNDYAWTKHASVLIYNSPPPVGFSYCDPEGPAGNGYSCGDWDDARTARTVHSFVNNWLKEFPEYTSNDLYLAGESYAGIYVPTLARAILADESSDAAKMLKGFAVGDACVGNEGTPCGGMQGPHYNVEFMHGHGQVSEKLYEKIQKTCSKDELYYGSDAKKNATGLSRPCDKVIDDMENQIGGAWVYNLYDDCTYQNDLAWKYNQQATRKYWGPPRARHLTSKLGAALNDYPCGGPHAMFTWVNQSAVRKALHVADDALFFSGDNGVGFNYKGTEHSLVPFYQHVAKETGLRVMVYNGDTDPCINSFNAQNWTSHIGLKETEAWRAWTLDGNKRMGGYVTRYEAKGAFDYVTIRGSGHMVPEFKPAAAAEMIKQFLTGGSWQKYKRDPSSRVEL